MSKLDARVKLDSLRVGNGMIYASFPIQKKHLTDFLHFKHVDSLTEISVVCNYVICHSGAQTFCPNASTIWR